jgi:hypothetical protein
MDNKKKLEEKLDALKSEGRRVQDRIISHQYEIAMLGLSRTNKSREQIATNTFSLKKNKQRAAAIQEEVSITKKMLHTSIATQRKTIEQAKYKTFFAVSREILPRAMYEMVLEETSRRIDGGE